MSLFAIADTHLSLGVNKPMSIFSGWEDYVQRLEQNWNRLVTDEDTVVIAGDVSWGMTLEQALPDFAFLHGLPGKKLILKGNHDYWWTSRKKMDEFFSLHQLTTLTIVHNDAVRVGEVCVCGTRGWFYDAEEDADKKIVRREAGRLNASLDAAEKLGGEPVVFLHYPPRYDGMVCEEIYEVLLRRQVRRCYYGHLHSQSIRKAETGRLDGIDFSLISADALRFVPLLVEKEDGWEVQL